MTLLNRRTRRKHYGRTLHQAISFGIACSITGAFGAIAYAEPATPAPATVPIPATVPAPPVELVGATTPVTPLIASSTAPSKAPATTTQASAQLSPNGHDALALLAPVALGGKPMATVAAVAGGPDIKRNDVGEPLINNSFADTDLKQALSDVSAQSGISIIADSTVQGTITLDLKDVPLEKALSMMLRSGGYAYTKIDDYYLVGAPDQTNPNFSLFNRTEIVQLQNVRPEVVLDLLSVPYGRYLSSEGSTRVATAKGSFNADDYRRSVGGGFGNVSNNSGHENSASTDIGLPAPSYKIAITAPVTLIPRIKSDILALDQKRPQVMLEAMVLEISQDDLKNMGFNLATRWLQFSTNTNNNGNGTTSGSNFGYSSVANNELVQISALIQKGAARVRANPRVATGDGQTAEMEVGKENYFSIVSGTAAYAYNTLEVIKSGISLRVTPRIQDGDQITALVEPEVRDVTGSGPNGLPEITFRRAAASVRVRNGESIVIGGLVNEYDVTNKSKIPLLGDIPIVGKAFRGENTRKARTETVIIVTPRILTDDEANDGIQSPVLKADVQTYREANHVKAADANGAGLTVPTLPPLVAPTPGVPAPGAPTP